MLKQIYQANDVSPHLTLHKKPIDKYQADYSCTGLSSSKSVVTKTRIAL